MFTYWLSWWRSLNQHINVNIGSTSLPGMWSWPLAWKISKEKLLFIRKKPAHRGEEQRRGVEQRRGEGRGERRGVRQRRVEEQKRGEKQRRREVQQRRVEGQRRRWVEQKRGEERMCKIYKSATQKHAKTECFCFQVSHLSTQTPQL